MQTPEPPADENPGQYSLGRLSAAFAQLTGSGDAVQGEPDAAGSRESSNLASDESSAAVRVGEGLSPQMIVEGMLFVGTAEGRPLSSRGMAAHIRDVSPKEVDSIVGDLNEAYQQQGVAYRIAAEGAGYRMQVTAEMESVRKRFGGRVREAKLTPSAIEVLSIVAYRQPITAAEVNGLRDSRSQRILSQLVRRQLLSLQRPEATAQRAVYCTTERFRQLFHLGSLADLPSSEDLDDG